MVSGDAALQQQLEALFLEELHDNVRLLSEGVAALATGPVDGDLAHQLFRAAHSLKGAAHSASVADAVAPCDRLEELLARLRQGDDGLDPAALSQLNDDIDRLMALERRLQVAAAEPAGGLQAPETAQEAQSRGRRTRGARPDARARVTVGRLERLVERTGELIAATHAFRTLAGDLEGITATVHRHTDAARQVARTDGAGPVGLADLTRRAQGLDRELRAIAAHLSDAAQELRLQPLHDVTAGLDHAVREVCRATGRDARLVVESGDVELDRDVGDGLREPLLHLVRNAIDHGIEAPERRAAVGKSRTGTVTIAAHEQGSRVVVTVRDDGAGVDVEALRRRLGPSPDSSRTDVELAFLPGLSTATAVSDVSGRGIGLDAARARVEGLGGTLHLRTQRGTGTEITIQVPRSLAVLRVLVVDSDPGGLIALPMSGITRLHRVSEADVEHVEGRLSVAVAGRPRPAVALADALALAAGAGSANQIGVAVELPDEGGVLLAGRAVTELDVVLRPLPDRVGGSSGLLGAALLPTGQVVLVANPSVALRHGLSVTAPPPVVRSSTRRRRVLLAEDTLTTRALERSILERAGYDVTVAVDGTDAWERLRGQEVDVVVTDVDMPGMSGIDLCRAIRSSVDHADLPVILVTSLASDDDRRRGLEVGASAYLVKSSFDQRALLDAIGRFV